MKLIKLTNNSHVLLMGNLIFLFSYSTAIAMLNEEEGILYLIKNYNRISCTTTKHTYLFIKTYYGYSKEDIEDLINKKLIVLVDTL